jgi:hypothetical protein
MDWNHAWNLCDFQYLILYQIGGEHYYYHWATNVCKCDVVEVVINPPSNSAKFAYLKNMKGKF